MRSFRIGSRPFQKASAKQSVWRSSQMPREPVLVPAVGARARVVVGEVVPGVAVGAVVLAHGAPRALGEVRAPAPPGRAAVRHLAAGGRARRSSLDVWPDLRTSLIVTGRKTELPCASAGSSAATSTPPRRASGSSPTGSAASPWAPSAGLRTRRYHGLLIVATEPPGGRMLGARGARPGARASATRASAWPCTSGPTAPSTRAGNVHLASFELGDGVPRWRWQIGDVILERELAIAHGRPAVAVVHRLVAAPAPVRLELSALGTWRDAHGERFAGGAPAVETLADGYVFEGAYRVAGPGYAPGRRVVRGRPLPRGGRARAGRPRGSLARGHVRRRRSQPGEALTVHAWAGDLARRAAARLVGARARARGSRPPPAHDEVDAQLLLAADQFVVAGPDGRRGLPLVRRLVARHDDLVRGALPRDRPASTRAAQLLLRSAATLSEGMLANTADTGTLEYNTADGTLWFLHAVGRHVARTGDLDLAAAARAAAASTSSTRHVARHALRHRGRPGRRAARAGRRRLALTWMDARVDGVPVTQRAGKAVEINALWINGAGDRRGLLERLGHDASAIRALERRARASFARRVRCTTAAATTSSATRRLRPNQLLAVSLPFAPLDDALGRRAVRAAAHVARPAHPRSGRPGLPRPPPRRPACQRDAPTTRARSGRG